MLSLFLRAEFLYVFASLHSYASAPLRLRFSTSLRFYVFASLHFHLCSIWFLCHSNSASLSLRPCPLRLCVCVCSCLWLFTSFHDYVWLSVSAFASLQFSSSLFFFACVYFRVWVSTSVTEFKSESSTWKGKVRDSEFEILTPRVRVRGCDSKSRIPRVRNLKVARSKLWISYFKVLHILVLSRGYL